MTTPLQPFPPPDQFLGLAVTQRQMAVLAALAHGDSNREIARQQGISAETVKKHVSLLMELFEVRNRVQLAVLVALNVPELLVLVRHDAVASAPVNGDEAASHDVRRSPN